MELREPSRQLCSVLSRRRGHESRSGCVPPSPLLPTNLLSLPPPPSRPSGLTLSHQNRTREAALTAPSWPQALDQGHQASSRKPQRVNSLDSEGRGLCRCSTKPTTDTGEMNACSGAPIKLYSQKQAGACLWPTGTGLLAPRQRTPSGFMDLKGV